MIGLGEACKLIQDQIGDNCRILHCYELPTFYMFDVHRRSSGILPHYRATAIGHCINKETGEYSSIDATTALSFLDEAQERDPFPYMSDDDINIVRAIRNTY